MDPAITAVMRAKDISLSTQIQTAVADKALDNMELQGKAMNQLLENAAQLSKDLCLGKKFDAVG